MKQILRLLIHFIQSPPKTPLPNAGPLVVRLPSSIPTMGVVLFNLLKIEVYEPAITLLDVCPKGLQSVRTNTCTQMFTGADSQRQTVEVSPVSIRG